MALSIYLEYEIREIPYPATTLSSILWLMKIGLDGSITNTQLSASNNANLFPGSLMPDGNGGVFATWTIVPPNPPAAPQPYQAAYVTSGGINTYVMPMAPSQVVNGPNGLPINPSLTLGENGTVFASYGANVTSFILSTGSVSWNYQTANQSTLSVVEATSDGGLTINDSDPGVIQLDVNGNASPLVSFLQGASPFTMSSWVGLVGGTLAEILSPNGSNGIPNTLVATVWPAPGGDPQGQHQPPFCQRQNSHCVLAPHDDTTITPDPLHSGAPTREVQYEVFSLNNGVLIPIPEFFIQKTRIVAFETNPTNPNTGICDMQAIDKGGCQSPNKNDGPGFYTDDYTSGNSGASTVTQQFIVDRGFVPVYWPQTAFDSQGFPHSIWYGAFSQNASTDRNLIPQGAFIHQNSPDMQHGAGCQTQAACSTRLTDGSPR